MAEFAKPRMAMGNEGTHASRLGQRQRLAVVGLTPCGVDLTRKGREVAQQMQRVSRETRLGWGVLERKIAKPSCIIESAEKECRTSQPSIVHAGLVESAARYAAYEKFLSLVKAAQGLLALAPLSQDPGQRGERVRQCKHVVPPAVLHSPTLEMW